MSEQGLARAETEQRHDAAVIVDDLNEVQRRAVLAKPAMRRSIVLPKLPDLLDLPAAHRLARGLVAGVRGEAVRERPAAHAGTVEFELMAAMHLRGGETIGRWRARPQELAEQIADFLRPCRMMIAAGRTRHPGSLAALGTGAQEVCMEDVEAAATELEFAGGIHRGKEAFAKARQDIANEWRRVSSAQLLIVFFKLRSLPKPQARAPVLIAQRPGLTAP